ncbi:MAG TPA: TIGR00366 family protein [Saprospiraceae bacterium]|nr:TIGR00366 family protein [Saprospiraceae bacterium]HMP25563.1 TIGR00366 family protein [Saprospiraceae bacterium]
MPENQPLKWYERIPHPVIMLFGIIVITAALSYILPAGAYEREVVDGRQRVVPGSYRLMASTPVGLLDLFRAIPAGFKTAVDIIFVVLASGIMFGVLERSRMVENTVGTIVKNLGLQRKYLIVVLMTFVYGFLGVAIGYENNIAMIPIAAVMSLALGGDLILAAGISVGAVTVGFGLSPINPYTVGTGHKIAEMPLFSGAPLRSVLCFLALSLLAYYNVRYFKKILTNQSKSLGQNLDTDGFVLSRPLETYRITSNNWLLLGIFTSGIAVMLYGIFNLGWYINEISAIFLMIAVLSGLAARMNGRLLSETVLRSIAVVAPGAFMVGYATSIKVVMEMGNISDTIAHNLTEMLTVLPTYASAVAMSLAQSVINFMIPSGSGQALATLPIMIPVGELLGLTRQTTILAFQIGDGVTNLINPTLGGLIAMLSMCRVPFDRWLRFIVPLIGWILLIAWAALLLSVYIEWGPV